MDPIDLVLTILGAAGVTGVIIAGLNAWLGRVWANRIAEAQKQALKMATEIDLNLRKRRIEVYKELWVQIPVLVSTLFRFKVSSLFVIKLYNRFALIL